MSINLDIKNVINKELLVNEASVFFKKSVPTIRKLIEKRKVKAIKRDNRVYVLYDELVKMYGDPISTNPNNNTNFLNIRENIINTDITNSQKEALERLILAKETQIDHMAKELENKNEEIRRLHKILENQQILNIETIKRIPEGVEKPKKFLGWFRRD